MRSLSPGDDSTLSLWLFEHLRMVRLPDTYLNRLRSARGSQSVPFYLLSLGDVPLNGVGFPTVPFATNSRMSFVLPSSSHCPLMGPRLIATAVGRRSVFVLLGNLTVATDII